MFARNDRTKKFFTIIDRYESTAAAAVFQGGNDGNIVRVESNVGHTMVKLQIGGPNGAEITLKKGQIDALTCSGLQDNDILDLQYLPRQLKGLQLSQGTLTGIDLSVLPGGLVWIILQSNRIRTFTVSDCPASLKEINLNENPLYDRGVKLEFPLPRNLGVCVTDKNSLNLGLGTRGPETGKGSDRYFPVTWPNSPALIKVY